MESLLARSLAGRRSQMELPAVFSVLAAVGLYGFEWRRNWNPPGARRATRRHISHHRQPRIGPRVPGRDTRRDLVSLLFGPDDPSTIAAS